MSLEIPQRIFSDKETLADDLSATIAGDLAAAIGVRDRASLVVSGGSTPRPLFAALRRRPIDWQRVEITLADERWVEPDDEASNEALVRCHLLVGAASRARFVGLKNAAPSPEEGCAASERALATLPRPFDVVVLGMGSDGHTASLFPRSPALARGLDPAGERLAIAVRPAHAPHPRLSLTLAALVDCRRLILHITGDGKRQVLRRALAETSAEVLPIAAVLRAAADRAELYWAP